MRASESSSSDRFTDGNAFMHNTCALALHIATTHSNRTVLAGRVQLPPKTKCLDTFGKPLQYNCVHSIARVRRGVQALFRVIYIYYVAYLASIHRTAAADEVDHSNRLVGPAEDGRVAGMPARCVPHAAVALQDIPVSSSTAVS